MLKKITAVVSVLFLALGARAQFYTGGGDPASLKWYSIQSDNYRIIYPEGLDSLARVYGTWLERYREPVSLSSGLLPGRFHRAKTPVLLHSVSAVSNGLVAWAPKRMELYTTPQPYAPEPLPWERNLAVHESRHLSQMQAGYRRAFKPLTWLFGEMIPGAVAGVYPGQMFLEGDAVVTETALTNAGRGRSGDFMNYYMSAFDDGDFRDFHSWQYGSWRHYAPDHYAAGYMAIAGKRVFFQDTLFTQRYFDNISRRPLRLNHFKREMARGTGMVFDDAYFTIMYYFYKMWNREAEMRAPFTESGLLTEEPDWFVSYSGAVPVADDIFVKRNGLIRPTELVRVDSRGNETRLRQFSSSTGRLAANGITLWWSESISDHRWSLKQDSRIRYMDLSDGKIHDLTRSGRYFNPVPSPDGREVAAVEYPVAGGTAVVVFDAASGEITSRTDTPDGFQAAEIAWTGNGLAVSGISDGGAGLYMLEDGAFRTLLSPQPVSLHSLSVHDGNPVFTSDRTGVNEIYMFDTASGRLLQLTSTRYGAGDGVFKADTLYYTSLTSGGRLMYRIPESGLLFRETDFMDIHKYEVADALSAQDRALAGGEPAVDETLVPEFSEPKRYRKLPHIPHFHSWAPVYLNSWDIDSNRPAVWGGGLTGFFQNTLGTASGSVGAGVALDFTSPVLMSPGCFLNFTYSGLYPEIEFRASVGERGTYQYKMYTLRYIESGTAVSGVDYDYHSEVPNVRASLRLSVPLNFSDGGVLRGVRPSLRYSISNDRFDKSMVSYNMRKNIASPVNDYVATFSGYEKGRNVLMQSLTASVSGYVMRGKAPSQEYPSLGIGGEIGYQCRLGLADLYTSGIYAHAYGYVPGLVQSHGVRLTALFQHRLVGDCLFGENVVNTNPRGFVDTGLMSYFSVASRTQLKLSADYALPVYFGDQSWSAPVAYITHYMVRPYVDVTVFDNNNDILRVSGTGCLFTAGADIIAKTANFLWLPYGAEIGFRLGFNGGRGMDRIEAALERMGRDDGGIYTANGHVYVGFLFSVDI